MVALNPYSSLGLGTATRPGPRPHGAGRLFLNMDGRPTSSKGFFNAVYADMRRLASHVLHRESPGHTLQPTALVHECFLRLADQERAQYNDEAHFMAFASVTMRRILVDHARARTANKRGGEWHRVELEEDLADHEIHDDLLALEDGLTQLEELDPRQAKIVEMRFFGGMSESECCEVLGVSRTTVSREWRMARAFLAKLIGTEL